MVQKAKGLNHRLGQLGISHFQKPIESLMAHFEGYPWPEEDESIRTELEQLLLDLIYLQSQDQTTPQDLCVRWRIKVANLRCWKCRAFYYAGAERIYWNPLEMSFRSFTGYSDVKTILAETEYPAKDIIRSWCKTKFRLLSQ